MNTIKSPSLKAIELIPGLKELLEETQIRIAETIGRPVKVTYSITIAGIRAGDLLDIICEVCDVEKAHVLGRMKYRELITARQLYCWFAYHNLKHKATTIAKVFYGGEHTSVLHSLKVAQDHLDSDDKIFVPLHIAVQSRINEEIKKLEHEKVQTETNG